MDFRLTDDQRALQQLVSAYCADRYCLDGVPRRVTCPLDRKAWTELADLGVFGLRAPDVDGGAACGVIEAVIVFEELARHLVSGPLLWSHLAAPLVPAAATGRVVVGGIARFADTGDPTLVEHLGDLDSLMVLETEGVALCEPPDGGLDDEVVPLDPLTPVSRLQMVPRGRRIGDSRVSARLRADGTVLTAAQLLGISTMTLDLAREYSLQREQFGRPIGSFQAVKHMLADMYVRSSLARGAVYAAAALLDDPFEEDAQQAVAAAKLLAGDAALQNARAAIQVFGGRGFTWEALPHFFLKRSWVLENQFGTSRAHALAIGSALRRECVA